MLAVSAPPAVFAAVHDKSDSPETITNEHPLSERKTMILLRPKKGG